MLFKKKIDKNNIASVVTKPWTIYTFILALLLAVPVIVIVTEIFGPGGSTWKHFLANLVPLYIKNTVIIVIFTGILTFILGVGTAWLVSMYKFPGHRFFEWALILPLSIPAYINGFTYAGILDYTSPIYTFLRNQFGVETGVYLLFDIMTLPGTIFIFSITLFPYVYLISRAHFMQQSNEILEITSSLGLSPLKSFYRVALPLARPAIVSGILLVIMEVLNDYGTVKYYGVETFTTGIFTSWFAFGDSTTALRLSSWLLLFVLIIIVTEKMQRGRAVFDFVGGNYKPVKVHKLKNFKSFVASITCFIPFLAGFLIPFSMLIYWAINTSSNVMDARFFNLALNSFMLALVTSLIIVVISLFMLTGIRNFGNRVIRFMAKFATIGYAIPGAVIAIGILIPVLGLDKIIGRITTGFHVSNMAIILAGSLTVLVYAYIVRFLAVGYYSLEAGYDKISRSLDETSNSLGASKIKTFFKVNLPLLKGSIVSAILLVFIDILKELPLTLILRPFNFDTLAIKAFEYASDEMVAESAPASLLIIIIGFVPVYLLNRNLSTVKS